MPSAIKYDARLVDHGRVMKEASFVCDDALKAYSEAHDGVDPLTGVWVDVRPAPEPKSGDGDE